MPPMKLKPAEQSSQVAASWQMSQFAMHESQVLVPALKKNVVSQGQAVPTREAFALQASQELALVGAQVKQASPQSLQVSSAGSAYSSVAQLRQTPSLTKVLVPAQVSQLIPSLQVAHVLPQFLHEPVPLFEKAKYWSTLQGLSQTPPTKVQSVKHAVQVVTSAVHSPHPGSSHWMQFEA